jgi:hypothetical protein
MLWKYYYTQKKRIDWNKGDKMNELDKLVGFTIIEVLLFIGAFIAFVIDRTSMWNTGLIMKWVIFSLIFWVFVFMERILRRNENDEIKKNRGQGRNASYLP